LYSAAAQYERARQKPEQTTDDFATYLDSLKLELRISDDAVQKNLLYRKLKDDLKRQISLYNKVP